MSALKNYATGDLRHAVLDHCIHPRTDFADWTWTCSSKGGTVVENE